jgi:Domain of unknown function (DUF4394)/Secretion system C-terminal sorting domain
MKKTITQTQLWALLFMLLTSVSINAQTIYGLTSDNKLVSFNATTPGTIATNVAITGLNAGQSIIGMDVRPATGEIIALGYNATTDSVSVYAINPTSAVATAKGPSIKLTGLGSAVGFDFNPTVDRIRLVSKNGLNYRLNPNNGALAATDLTLKYATTDANTGKTPGATACAYTNSYIASTNTQLFTYDETQKVMTFQNPPNDGVLNTQASFSGIASTAILSDLDIYTNPTTFASTTYAVVRTGSLDSLYSLNITTGAFNAIGALGVAVTDIAVAINRTVPALQGSLAYGLTFTAGNSAFNFLQFDTKNPTFIRSAQTITGLKTGQNIVGMDVRPQDGKIYTLGYRSTDSVATIYTLNETTAALTAFAGADSFKLALTGQVTFDFNPAANRLRIISATNSNNYRLNLTVNPITVTTDTSLTYRTTDVNTGKTPVVVTGAYTNSFNGATATQLYDIDASLNNFVNQNTANGGFLNTVGALGLILDPNDYTIDLDIYSNKATPSVDSAFLMANVTGSNGFDNLYTLNIGTGATTLVNRIGLGIALRNIAVALSPLNTSVKDLPQTLQTAIYPNPASSQITLSFDNQKGSRVNVAIFNLQGQLVQREVYETGIIDFNKTLDVSKLPNGAYMIRVSNDFEATVKKLMKF